MQKRSCFLVAFLFFGPLMIAQDNSGSKARDSAWFENYFARHALLLKTDPEKALDSLEIIKQIAVSSNYYPAINRYFIEKAAWFLSKGANDSAINYYLAAIKLAKKENKYEEIGNAYLTLANFYQFNGNTLAAAENYLQATRLLKDLGRKRTLIGLYWNLLTVLNRLQQKNGSLQNMLAAVVTDKSSEADLIKIINTRDSEEEGLHFPDQSLVKEVGTDAIYVIFGDAKFPVLNFGTLASYGAMRDVQRIPAGTLSLISDVPRNGSIVKEFTGDPKVYLVKDSILFHIANPDVLENYGGWDALYFVPSNSLRKFTKSEQQVTLENVNTIFNLNQEFDILTDSIQSALQKNSLLSNTLSRTVAYRNNALQKRKIWLGASGVGLIALLLIVLLLIRNFRQKQKIHAQSLTSFKAEQELKRKMELEKERTRIATDMHDDLGAGLSRIKFLSETIGIKKQKQQPIGEDINSIRQYSHEMIDKMGEIVWALNEKNDSLVDLLSYTRAYTVEYLTQHGIGCEVKMPDTFPTLFVSGEIRRNIYLCVKEALHNVVKHAQASQVSITISIENNLVLDISDNGTGFDPANIRAYSNGLANMKKRMTDIGGSLAINNNSGTELKLSVPLHL